VKTDWNPKWAFPWYVAMAVVVGGYAVFRMVRGGDSFIFFLLFAVFAFNAWANWYTRRKRAHSPPE